MATKSLWDGIRRYSRLTIVIPLLAGITFAILTGRALLLEVGAVWFLSAIAILVVIEAFASVKRKLPRRKVEALAALLQYGGYSIAAGSTAGYFALAFWTTRRPDWLIKCMFAGIGMFFASGLVYLARGKKSRSKGLDDSQ